ncbi:MAG: hypothetical protein K2Y27_35375 [Xanthobacteraceae bacterium]|nr:hypothetical protein [Xanthobacteraceae bacterium]
MLPVPNCDARLGRLAGRLRLAEGPTADVIGMVVADACPRTAMLDRANPAARRIEMLTKSAAWTELALDLVARELPFWSLRSLVFDDGAWFCSLSSRPGMPLELDDTADASHESLPLAILAALVEARRKAGTARTTQTHSVPRVEPERGHALCCDNFG